MDNISSAILSILQYKQLVTSRTRRLRMKRSSRTAAVVARMVNSTIIGGTKSNNVNTTTVSASTKSRSSSRTKPAKEPKPSVPASEDHGSVPAKKTKVVQSNNNKKATTRKSKIDKAVQSLDEISPYFPPTLGISTTAVSKMPRDFYNQECVALCKALLGTVLVRKLPETGQIVRGTIVETEAYAGHDDKASNSYQGRRTPGNEAMFLDPGTAYVYMTYGMYFCFNISSKGEGSACLLRAVEPLEDYEIMHSLRKPQKKKKDDETSTTSKGKKALVEDAEGSKKTQKRLKPYELANGPSKICMAFNIRKDSCDKLDMVTSDEMWIEQSTEEKYRNRKFEIDITKRIGIDSAPPESRDRLLRFLIRDNLAVSKAKVSDIKKRLAEAESS